MMNGGVVPAGICVSSVCEIAVTCAVAASIFAPGWKKILMTDDAVERLALDVLDVVDRGGEPALVVADDALLHLLGARPAYCQTTEMTGMSMSGKMSVGIRRIVQHAER